MTKKNKIVWLDPGDVKSEATTPKKALALAVKHWWQNSIATRKEQSENKDCPVSAESCGLCVYYRIRHDGHCDSCPVSPRCALDVSLYGAAEDAWTRQRVKNTKQCWDNWITAAKVMHKYLCSLRVKK